MHNIPPSQPMFEGERILRFDRETQRHMPVDRSTPDAAPDDQGRALAALRLVTGEGKRVTRTGAHELYKHDCPELAGVPRRKVQELVNALIAAGRAVLVGAEVRPS